MRLGKTTAPRKAMCLQFVTQMAPESSTLVMIMGLFVPVESSSTTNLP